MKTTKTQLPAATQTAQDIPKLRVQYDFLHIGDTMLMKVYDAGDIDTIPWPFKETSHWDRDKWNEALASALYDARETGDLPSATRTVLLPDRQEFVIDDYVS